MSGGGGGGGGGREVCLEWSALARIQTLLHGAIDLPHCRHSIRAG